MMTIRPEQVAVFERQALKRFGDQLARDLRKTFPVESAAHSDSALRALVDAGIARCGELGIRAERAVTRFVYLMVMHSPGFEDATDMAWTKRFLDNRDLSGEAKVDLIWSRYAPRWEADRAAAAAEAAAAAS